MRCGTSKAKRPRGATIPIGAHPLAQTVFALMSEREWTYARLAETAGISRETLTSWRSRSQPDLSNIAAVLNTMGLRLEIVDADGSIYRPRPETLARRGITAAERAARWAKVDQGMRDAMARRSKPSPLFGHNGGPALHSDAAVRS